MGVTPRHLWRLFAACLALGLAGGATILAALGEFHEELAEPRLACFDRGLTGAIRAWAAAPLTRLMLAPTAASSWWAVGLVAAAGAAWRSRRRRWAAVAGQAVALGGAGVLNAALKLWFGRPRPAAPWAMLREQSSNFPSGHAKIGLVGYGMLAYLVCRLHRRAAVGAAVAAATALVLGIGASRVYLGVHFPGEIIAGYADGGLWLLSVIGGMEALSRVASRKPARWRP